MTLIGTTARPANKVCRCGHYRSAHHPEPDPHPKWKTLPEWCLHCGCSFFQTGDDDG